MCFSSTVLTKWQEGILALLLSIEDKLPGFHLEYDVSHELHSVNLILFLVLMVFKHFTCINSGSQVVFILPSIDGWMVCQ